MPELSRFLGIIVAMYYNDHQPPHFHAKYDDFSGIFSIPDLQLIEGKLPRRIIALVLEWAFEHREELMEDWRLAIAKKPLNPIKPLIPKNAFTFHFSGTNARFEPKTRKSRLDKPEHTSSYVRIWTDRFDAVFGQRLRFAKNAIAFFGLI